MKIILAKDLKGGDIIVSRKPYTGKERILVKEGSVQVLEDTIKADGIILENMMEVPVYYRHDIELDILN